MFALVIIYALNHQPNFADTVYLFRTEAECEQVHHWLGAMPPAEARKMLSIPDGATWYSGCKDANAWHTGNRPSNASEL